MFDTAKVQQMMVVLERFAREREDVYVIPEWLNGDAFALFRRMQIPIRAVLLNAPPTFPQREVFGCPILLLNDAARNFTPRTGIILLSAKPQPNFLSAATFTLGNRRLNVPIFAAASDEVLALYDRLTLIKVLQQYREDGIYFQPKDIATRFARGLTTFLDPRFQNFKYQLWDSREYFKPRYDFDDTAIVIQGPITYENNYTAETFKLYRSIYPNVPIVVSTWRGETTDAFRRECEKNSVVLLENEMPAERGYLNVNLQLESSHRGVEFVRENTSAKFVMKTRTDQRFNRFDCLVYFKNLLETFPPDGNKLQQRIILLGSFPTRVRPFYFYDYFSFGHLLDISRLYSIPLARDSDEKMRRYKNPQRSAKITKMIANDLCPLDYDFVNKPTRKLRNFNKMVRCFWNPEIYITRKFYEKYIASVDETKLLETGWKFTRDYILLIDYDSVLFDWCKYEFRRYTYIDRYTRGRFAFARWLDMYRNFNIDWV